MRKTLLGLTTLLAVACSPQKETHVPEVNIPEIKLQQKVIEKPLPQPEEPPANNEYRNLGKECNQILLEDGKYPVKKEGWDALYIVRVWDGGKSCDFSLSNSEIMVTIIDSECDNTANRVDIEGVYSLLKTKHGYSLSGKPVELSFERTELESLGYKKHFDRMLEEAQPFSCPENKRRLEEYMLNKVFEVDKNKEHVLP